MQSRRRETEWPLCCLNTHYHGPRSICIIRAITVITSLRSQQWWREKKRNEGHLCGSVWHAQICQMNDEGVRWGGEGKKKWERLQLENDSHLRSALKPITPILIIHLGLSIISKELREDFNYSAEFTFFSVTFIQQGGVKAVTTRSISLTSPTEPLSFTLSVVSHVKTSLSRTSSWSHNNWTDHYEHHRWESPLTELFRNGELPWAIWLF